MFLKKLETFIRKVPEASLGDVHRVLKDRQMEDFNHFYNKWQDDVLVLGKRQDGDRRDSREVSICATAWPVHGRFMSAYSSQGRVLQTSTAREGDPSDSGTAGALR